MKIGGLQKLSLIEYDGILSCIVFTIGCNFRCPYCHNPELVLPEKFPVEIPLEDFFQFLKQRQKYLKGVCITGGEPTIQTDLPVFIKEIKELGFSVKLDTNGSNPEMLEDLIKNGNIDYIALDVKGPLEKYNEIVKVEVDTEKILKSIYLIKNSAIPYEFRTTVVKSQLSFDDFKKIGKTISGCKNYYLQKFIPSKCVDPSFINEPTYSDDELEKIKEIMLNYVENCYIR